jgi:hypothetical protein
LRIQLTQILLILLERKLIFSELIREVLSLHLLEVEVEIQAVKEVEEEVEMEVEVEATLTTTSKAL